MGTIYIIKDQHSFFHKDSGSQEARVLIVDLLICNVTLQKAITVNAKNVTNVLVEDKVRCFFTFSQDYQVVTTLVLSRFLLVGWWLWHWQIVCLDLGEELLEVFVHVLVAAHLRSPANKEFNWNWRCHVIVTRESDRNVDSKNVSRDIHLVHEPPGKDAMPLEHLKFEEGVEAVLATTCIEREF